VTARRILILCTGNSCRSQLAEALVNHDFAGRWEAVSAGTRPAGYVHTLAVRALAELGIDHTGASKHVDAFRGQAFDLVLTVCDSANEDCPVWLGSGRRVHIGFPDPAAAQGDETAVLQVFRDVRDDIRTHLAALLAD
jgi:arsenate reductase (thioredoxin)